MKKYNLICLYLLLFGLFLMQRTILARNTRPPRLTVVLVVDQFAHHYIDKLYPHFKYGLLHCLNIFCSGFSKEVKALQNAQVAAFHKAVFAFIFLFRKA